MKNAHYLVGDKKFYNYYQAIKWGHADKKFVRLVLPEFDDFDPTQKEIQSIMSRSSSYWIGEKLKFLRKNYNIRLHYSGGVDSQTILEYAQKTNLNFDQTFLYLTSPYKNAISDEEYMPAKQNLINNKKVFGDVCIEQYSIKDYEVWLDAETPYKYNSFYHGFRPNWSGMFMRNIKDDDILNVLGTEKPWFYFTEKKSYWVICDHFFYLGDKKCCDFFIDTLFPELMINQIFTSLDFIRSKGRPRGMFSYKQLTEKEQTDHNILLGRTDAADRSLNVSKTSSDWKDNSLLNKKHQLTLQEVDSHGHADIVDGWFNTSDRLIRDLQDIPYGIRVKNVRLPALSTTQRSTVDIAEPFLRIGAIYECDDYKLERVPHNDISLLE